MDFIQFFYLYAAFGNSIRVASPEGYTILTTSNALELAVAHMITGKHPLLLTPLSLISKEHAKECYLMQEEITGEEEEPEMLKHSCFLHKMGVELVKASHKWTWNTYIFLVKHGYDVPRNTDSRTAISLGVARPSQKSLI
jgi:hypothetical protein